jgi:hypothetical protein
MAFSAPTPSSDVIAEKISLAMVITSRRIGLRPKVVRPII